MTHALMLIGIGPVQAFIESARRMRDLWFGSQVLSDMARAAATRLASDGWELIFPADTRGGGGVSNKILAYRTIDAGTTVEGVAEAGAAVARAAAVARWQAHANKAIEAAGPLLHPDLPPAHHPRTVIEDLLEFYAVWAAFDDSPSSFAASRERVERDIDARKGLRDFVRWHGAHREKNSLDGFRESVLVERSVVAHENGRRVRRFAPEIEAVARKGRLGDTEFLDGVAFVKRFGGEPDAFPPVARVTLARWIEEAEACAKEDDELGQKWRKLRESCQRLRVPRTSESAASWLQGSFPFDGEIFFEGRWRSLDFGTSDQDACRDFGRRSVLPVLRLLDGSPNPYVAVIRADGDRMGRLLDALARNGGAARLRDFSRALGDFAVRMRDTVESHRGVLIYSGGDDVLAIVPVQTAIACARSIHRRFEEAVKGFRPDPELGTLSIGVAIAHTLTPLGDILALARDAEGYAKDGDGLDEKRSRNALAVLLDKRGGALVRWRARWDLGPCETIEQLSERFKERTVSHKLPYELREALRRLPDRDDQERSTEWARILRSEVRRIVARKEPGAQRDTAPKPEVLGLALDDKDGYGEAHDKLAEWIDEASVASFLADAQRSLPTKKKEAR